MMYKNAYKVETISPARICDALKYLIDTPLFKKYEITIDEHFLKEYEGKYDETTDFIVDENDIKIVEDMYKEQDRDDNENRKDEQIDSNKNEPSCSEEILDPETIKALFDDDDLLENEHLDGKKKETKVKDQKNKKSRKRRR